MSITAMKQALEALERPSPRGMYDAITALRQAIEQAEKAVIWERRPDGKIGPTNTPQQEFGDTSAAYMVGVQDGKKQREWVGLTDEEIDATWGSWMRPYAHMVLKKLKEKANEQNQ